MYDNTKVTKFYIFSLLFISHVSVMKRCAGVWICSEGLCIEVVVMCVRCVFATAAVGVFSPLCY